MASKKRPELSKRERQIMDLIYKNGDMTAKAVMENMADAPVYATVRSLLRILEEKGHLQHYKKGKQFVYQAVAEPEKVGRNSLKHLLQTFFKGSITEAVATFINDPESNLSEQELDELDELIKKARK